MSEIISAEPIHASDEAECSSRNATRFITDGRDDYVPEPFESERLPVTLVPHIRPFLRVANQIGAQEPRVAYICRFHAFEIAHKLDCSSSGRGVRQFKTALLQRLEQDEEVTISRRKEKNDLHELRRVYIQYKDYISRHSGRQSLEIGEKLLTAHVIAYVLSEILETFTKATHPQGHAANERTDTNPGLLAPYNILPLDHDGANIAIMRLPEALKQDHRTPPSSSKV